jgi:hypothetical protein
MTIKTRQSVKNTKTSTLRTVSQDEFDTAVAQWYPKIVKFATNRIAFLDWDDKIQEAQLVLYKCLQRFETGHGAIFHTYFHRALFNRAGVLAHRPLKHNEDPMKVTYLGEMDAAASEENGRAFTAERQAASFDFSTSVVFEVQSWGFTGAEIPYVYGVLLNKLTLKECATLFDLDVEVLKGAKETVKEKLAQLKEEVTAWQGK